MFELAPIGSAGEMLGDAWLEIDWMRRLSASMERPVSYVLLQVDDDPELWRKQLAASLEACAEGAMLFPQIAGRPTGLLTGHHATLCLFSDFPEYQELRARGLSVDELGAALADPELRRRITSWTPSSPAQAAAMEKAYERTFVLGDPPDYEPGPERSLAGMAAARGMTPLEVAYDEMARDNGQGLLYLPILNYATGDLDHVHEMLLHPRGLLGLSDGGAHTGTICDASMPTFMLTHWTRDRSRGATLPLEYVVKKQTHDTARLYGLSDRGTVEVGALGDLNLIDYDGLTLGAPFVRSDLPAGGRRLLQQASGYVCTIKKGTVTFEGGEPTGEHPGRLRARRALNPSGRRWCRSGRRRRRLAAAGRGRCGGGRADCTRHERAADPVRAARRPACGVPGVGGRARSRRRRRAGVQQRAHDLHRRDGGRAQLAPLHRAGGRVQPADPLRRRRPGSVGSAADGDGSLHRGAGAATRWPSWTHAGCESAVVLAPVAGAMPALWLAATHPERVRSAGLRQRDGADRLGRGLRLRGLDAEVTAQGSDIDVRDPRAASPATSPPSPPAWPTGSASGSGGNGRPGAGPARPRPSPSTWSPSRPICAGASPR